MLANFGLFFLAAFFEIFGCYAFWMNLKLEKNSLWLAVGIISLILFAYLLTKVDVAFAGRAYAIYGGVYIVSSLLWLIGIEKQSFSRWDIVGALVALLGVVIIFLGNQKH